jgi:hypothetical protein
MSEGFTVHVEFDTVKLMARIEADTKKGITAVANEALKDANYYARKDSSEMVRSSIRASRPEEGELVWDTPYAKKVYYTGTPSKDNNPNATLMWAHRGYAANRAKYDRIMAHVHGAGVM